MKNDGFVHKSFKVNEYLVKAKTRIDAEFLITTWHGEQAACIRMY